MAMRPRLVLWAVIVGSLVLLMPPRATAQHASAPRSVGVVTAIQGQATVARQALPEPVALRFKDDVFLRDRISTREQSTVRLLLGGRATVTVRELSQFAVEETVLPDRSQRSVIDLLAGKIGAAIVRTLMRPGDSVEIRTPDAVAAVRGTVLIAEYIPPRGKATAPAPYLLASGVPGPVLAQAPIGGSSNFFVLSGFLEITVPGHAPFLLSAMRAVSVFGTPTGPQVGPITTLTPARAAQLGQDLQVGKQHTGEPDASRAAQVRLAVSQSQQPLQAPEDQPDVISTLAVPRTPNNTVAPVVPQIRTDPSESQGVRSINSLSLSDLK